MDITRNSEIRPLIASELDEVSGGAFLAGVFTSALATVATTAQPKKLRILTETMERSTQTVQK